MTVEIGASFLFKVVDEAVDLVVWFSPAELAGLALSVPVKRSNR